MPAWIPKNGRTTAKYRISSGNLPMNRKKATRDSFPVRGKRKSKAVAKMAKGNAISSNEIVV